MIVRRLLASRVPVCTWYLVWVLQHEIAGPAVGKEENWSVKEPQRTLALPFRWA